jgi:rhodanese-related sulfurtransferase
MKHSVPEMTAAEAAARRETDPNIVLLDVREHDEVALARIDGAQHIPMGDIPGRLQHLDPERTLIVFCHKGARSYRVAAWLRQQGLENVFNMAGGIDAWSLEVDPTVPRYK